eukprot:TRINITY_DN1700_c0_g1_i4.p1 TRINITY_DN1700_c0_g1~~TRINITY_DN1700_c0_g1_i4.p1  ORF type:complete len:129 (+),score=4.03 TRINITY_DN1700_c0_g1_i4:148-534(+)
MAAISSTTSKPVIIKCLLDGNSGVGKTAILLRYCDNTFTDQFVSTIGIDFKLKKIVQNDMEIRLQVWDQQGRERYRTRTPAFYRGVRFILAIFSVTDLESFEYLQNHLTEMEKHRPENSVVAVVANKN